MEKINSEDVIIGTCLQVKSSKQPFFVTGFSPTGVVFGAMNFTDFELPIDEVEPIPITRELLLDRSFKKSGNSDIFIYSWGDDNQRIMVYFDHSQIPFVRLNQSKLKLPFLHQLQRLVYDLSGGFSI